MELTEEQRAFLNETHFAVVATIAPDGMPHQTVMWYLLEGDELLLNTPRDSLKHRHLKRDPRISICVEKTYRYLTLIGTVSLDEDPATARTDYQRIGARYRNSLDFSGPPTRSSGQVRDLLSRERISLHMKIEKVIGN